MPVHLSDVTADERCPQSTGYSMGQSHLISKVGQRGQLQESSTVGHVIDQRNQLAAPDLELGTGRRVVPLDKARQFFEPIQVKVSVTANQAVGGRNQRHDPTTLLQSAPWPV